MVPARISARLTFQDLIGVASAAAVVEFDASLQRCITVDDGLGLGLVLTEDPSLSEEEAAACAHSVGEVCQELLPEPEGLLPQPPLELLGAWRGLAPACQIGQ